MAKRSIAVEAVRGHGASWWRLATIMCMRLVVITAIVAGLAFLLPGDSVAFYAFMAFTYIATIPYALWLKNHAAKPGLLPVQFVIDLLWVTGLVYFTGGADSDLTMLYPLVILSAGLLTDPRGALQIAVLSTLAYILLVVLMAQQILVPYRQLEGVETVLMMRTIGSRVFLFLCFGLISAYVSQRCHYADQQAKRFRDVAEIIFRNVRAGLMLVDDNGCILMANTRACEMLKHEEQSLVGQALSSITRETSSASFAEEGDASVEFFMRSDGTEFPVSYERSRVSLPGEMVPGREGGDSIDAEILVFSDITRMIDMQDKARYADQVKAATQVASEIAHELRSPLTAISGTLQLLGKLEQQASEGHGTSTELLNRERKHLYANVVQETSRLDYIVERFINCASFSPEAVNELLAIQNELHPGAAVRPPAEESTVGRE
jgi:two-component system sensor histidine kinase PilS (NtrC family)